MGRIVERVRVVGPLWTAMLLAVVALAAAAACADESSEAGTAVAQEQPVEAVRQGEETVTEPLTLALSAPQTCETERAKQHWDWGRVIGDDGVERDGAIFLDEWSHVEEVDVAWTASGGTAPYLLTIDGETRDHVDDYFGASGTASVSCAMRFGETFIAPAVGGQPPQRRYRADPQVDSGLKTIRATVTDGAGATAEVSVDLYVILQIEDSGEILESGKTYRVHRFLVTVPEELTLVIGTTAESTNSTSVSLGTPGPRYQTWIWIDPVTGEARNRYFRHGYGNVKTDGTLFQSSEDEAAGLPPKRIEVPEEIKRIDALLDELVESINRLPTVERAD